MMAKIAICTIVSMNYGNRLQNYALSKEIQKLGYEVETIRRYHVKKKWIKSLKKRVRTFIIKDKYTYFYLFDKKIAWSDSYINQYGYSDNIESEYDAFIVGSDQVWNLTFDFINENYFLPFVKHKRKIAYSASFGVDHFDESLYKQAEGLLGFSRISVREEAGVEITKHITGRIPEVLIDPTMLLTKEEWGEVSKKPRSIDLSKPYILLYFLGSIPNDQKSIINEISQRYDLKIHSVLGDNNAISNCGPSEFIYLIANASMVLTDSFHACVFSIIFKKTFTVFKRESEDADMSSRLLTLLRKFHLEERYITDQKAISTFDYLACSFEGIDDILINERQRSEAFLKDALREL